MDAEKRRAEMAATGWLEELLLAGDGGDRGKFFACLHELVDAAKNDALPNVEEAVELWAHAVGWAYPED